MENIVILGSGGHAKVIIDIIRENNAFNIIGCLSKNASVATISGVPILGEDVLANKIFNEGTSHAFVAIGDNQLRLNRTRELVGIGFELANIISTHAVVSSSVKLGVGIAIMPGAVINTETSIGDCVIVNTNASIDHDCVIGDAVHIAPGSNLAGKVSVEEGSFLGIGTKVIPHVTIGKWTTIGAGGTVIKDMPAHVVAVGTPAKIIKEYVHE